MPFFNKFSPKFIKSPRRSPVSRREIRSCLKWTGSSFSTDFSSRMTKSLTMTSVLKPTVKFKSRVDHLPSDTILLQHPTQYNTLVSCYQINSTLHVPNLCAFASLREILSSLSSYLIIPRSLVSINVTSSFSSGDSGRLRPISASACLVFSLAR
jgi:hypothetical protein